MNMREDLKAFIDNEISEEERTRILKELEDNPELQAEVIELRQISRVIHEEAWQPEPVGLEKTLRALDSSRTKRPWWMGPAFTWAVGAACTVIMAAVLFPVFAQSKEAAKKSSLAFAESEDKAAFASGVDAGWQGRAKSAAPMRSPQVESSTLSEDVQVAAEEPSKGYARDTSLKAQAGASADSRSQYANPQAPASTPSRFRFEIKTANLSVEVEDVPKAQQEAEGIAKAVNGRIERSNKNNDEGQLASAELTFRVPVASFETAVNRIRKLGRVLNDSLNGDDVTTQVVDTGARLKVLRAEEDQYVELLKATKKIGEVLSVKERLSQVRQQIESLDAQYRVLRDQAAESTIHLSLTERPKPDRPKQNDDWSEDAWSRAVAGLNSVGRALGSAAVFLFVFSPIWMPVVLLFWWLARRAKR